MDMHGRATQSLSLSRIPIATNPSDRFFERIEKGVELRKTLLLKDDDFVIFCVEYDRERESVNIEFPGKKQQNE